MDWYASDIKSLIALALREDQARDDITTRALIDPGWQVDAALIAKQEGIVSGLPFAKRVFQTLDPRSRFVATVREGESVRVGQRLAQIRGNARSILSAERPALNALQHLSGIATFTQKQVHRLGRSKTRLFDTRKTLPGWRRLDKYAVRCGGGENHRMALGDAVLVKENHLRLCRLAGKAWLPGILKLRKKRPSISIQVEIQTDQDLRDAIILAPHRVLLDNLPRLVLRRMIRTLRRKLPETEIEISGGIRPEQLSALSRLGVERISMGKLTHSAPAFDCSLDILRVYPR